jgi:hypothetical protein
MCGAHPFIDEPNHQLTETCTFPYFSIPSSISSMPFNRMAQNSIHCSACDLEFPNPDDCFKHIRFYQSEFISTQCKVIEVTQKLHSLGNVLQELHARLSSLAIHSGVECDPPSIERHLKTALPRGTQKAESRPHRDDGQEPRSWSGSDTMGKNDALTAFPCNHDDCENDKKFSRKQDLERHWGLLHYDASEYCELCDTVFTQPTKYLQHNCARSSSGSQRKHMKVRCAAVREKIRTDLARNNIRKRPGDTLCRDSDKRQKDAAMSERPSRTITPLDESLPNASLPSEEPCLHISALSDTESNGNTHMQYQQVQAPMYIGYANTTHQQGQSTSSYQEPLDLSASESFPVPTQLQPDSYQEVYAPIYSTAQSSLRHTPFDHSLNCSWAGTHSLNAENNGYS